VYPPCVSSLNFYRKKGGGEGVAVAVEDDKMSHQLVTISNKTKKKKFVGENR